MLNNKVVAVLSTVLLVAVAVLGYLFYETYTEIKNGQETIPAKEDTQISSTSKVPAGTEIPLGETAGNKLPVTTDPDGIQLPSKVNAPVMKEDKTPVQNKTFSDSSQWKTYTNKKYGYSFKYPSDFDFRDCTNENPCKYGQVSEKDGGDLAYISAQTNQRGWPYVTVAHYNNENFTLAKDQKLIDWFKGKFQGESVPKDYNYEIKSSKGNPKKAIRTSFPQTPQAHSKEEIYFAEGNNIFQIQLLDTNKPESWEFYNPWLDSFVLEK